jgi:hypothetical protein
VSHAWHAIRQVPSVLTRSNISTPRSFFGYSSWSFPVALLRELQRLGIAAPLPAMAAA